MIVVRASYSEGQLLVWSEPESDRAWLLTAVAAIAPATKSYQFREAVVWLPSQGGKPVMAGGDVDAPCTIAPYVVAVLPLDALQAINVLAACADKRLAAPGVLIGDDLEYWVAAMRFAAGLAIRGQFLPGLLQRDGEYEARWAAVVGGADAARLEALAKAMPASARALGAPTQEQPPNTAAQSSSGGIGL